MANLTRKLLLLIILIGCLLTTVWAAVRATLTSNSGASIAGQSVLVISSRTSGVRYSGFVENAGPNAAWANRDGTSTTNGHYLAVGGRYAVTPPTRSNGEWFGVDNGPVYLFSTNTTYWSSEEGVVSE